MKKTISVISLSLLLVGCSSNTHQESNTTTATPVPTATPETVEVVEQLNVVNTLDVQTKTLDMDGYQWLTDSNPAFEQISMSESLRFYEEGGTGIIFYSYDTCPWCNRAVTVLNDAAKEMGIKVYYADVYESEVLDGQGGFSEEGNATIERLMTDLDSILDHEENEETGEMEPVFYTPTVVAVKDGEIVGYHVALVDSFHLVNENTQMTDAEKQELKEIYQDLMRAIATPTE